MKSLSSRAAWQPLLEEKEPEAEDSLERAWLENLDRLFEVTKRGSDLRTELRAGLVMWVTMSYIVVVNPLILSTPLPETGESPVPFRQCLYATCLSAALASGFVGLFANLPFGLAAGMGLNSYFRYSMVGELGMPVDAALGCCVVQAMLFALLTVTGAASWAQDAVPNSLKAAITVAIGIFQAFLGFQLMGLVVKSDETLVALGDLSSPRLWIALISTLLVAVLTLRRQKGAMLLGLVLATCAAHLLGLADDASSWSSRSAPQALPGVNNRTEITGDGLLLNAANGTAALTNLTAAVVTNLTALPAEAAAEGSAVRFMVGGWGWHWAHPGSFLSAVFCLLFVVAFDTAGVQHGIGFRANLLDEEGRLPGSTNAFLGSVMGTFFGGIVGTSPVIIHNESAAAVQEGGRTGLAALTTAFLFTLSPFLAPVLERVPAAATAPCLVMVGVFMMAPVAAIDFSDLRVALPCFLTIAVTPLTFSIATGVFAGLLAHFALQGVEIVLGSLGTGGDSLDHKEEAQDPEYGELKEGTTRLRDPPSPVELETSTVELEEEQEGAEPPESRTCEEVLEALHRRNAP